MGEVHLRTFAQVPDPPVEIEVPVSPSKAFSFVPFMTHTMASLVPSVVVEIAC